MVIRFRWFPRAFALVCMAYMTYQLYHYLQLDPLAYLPSIGQWFVGLFLSVMTVITKGGFMAFNLLFMAGLSGLVLIY